MKFGLILGLLMSGIYIIVSLINFNLIGLIIWIIVIFADYAILFYRGHRDLMVVPAFAAMVALVLHGLMDTPYFKNDLSLLFWFIVAINIAVTMPQIKPATT